MPVLRKVLIANRGEIAVRVIRACQEMGIATLSVYSSADAGSLPTYLADESICIGPAPALESYLNGDMIVRIAQDRGCDAIHPGYGFLSENSDFAAAVGSAGLIFVGPSAAAIQAMGSKITSRELMQEAGVPVIPGFHPHSEDPASQAAELIKAAPGIGYPLLVKAAAGGGGKGMRAVWNPSDLSDAITSAQREAGNAFDDPTVYLEKIIEDPRHVEFQILADHHGNVIHLCERECSIQRRHQKIIEETPSPALTAALRAQMGAAAVQAARSVAYTNAGTVEFLLSADDSYYFLEMNTRLQVEHPITEQVVGIDLVKAQLRIAAGEALPWHQEDISQRGHAFEARIYAEDPARDFLPSTGNILAMVEPEGPGIRIDAGITGGDDVSMYYDPMIAKLICHGEHRLEALRKLDWALANFMILGITTNIPYLRAIIQHAEFVAGEVSTDFISRYLSKWGTQPQTIPDQALIAAALADYLEGAAASPALGGAGADPYNPWCSLDGFRLGTWHANVPADQPPLDPG